jgi:hypothetical protein
MLWMNESTLDCMNVGKRERGERHTGSGPNEANGHQNGAVDYVAPKLHEERRYHQWENAISKQANALKE